MEIQHFCHDQHPLVFKEDERGGYLCYACREPVLGPSYSCIKCDWYYHHKSCAELPRELQHPSHPKHPLILFDEWEFDKDKKFSKCEVCKENRWEYTYGCFRCNFNLHTKCASLPLTLESEVHDHPLTHIWKLMKFAATFVAKKAICPFFVPSAVSVFIKLVLLLIYAKSKLYVTTTPSISPILPVKYLNLIPHFVNSVFEKWT